MKILLSARTCLSLLAFVACCFAIAPALAADSPDTPVLRIDTGQHDAIVHGLSISPDGQQIATASYDRTVRIWTVPGLDLVRTIHMPVGPGIEGAVYAIAFSPDGKTLVTAGWTGGWDNSSASWCFYIISLSSGDIAKTVCDMPQRANTLIFSPDGKYLAVALKRGADNDPYTGGIRVYRTSDFTLVKDDKYGDASDWVEFDLNGRMVTSSLDGKVRLYDANLNLIHAQSMPQGRKPDQIAVSPDGRMIAVGYFEPEGDDPFLPPAIDVISSTDLSVLFRPDLRGVDNGALWRVAWSADGSSLYAGGSWHRGNHYFIRRWSDAGKGRPFDIPASTSRVLRMRTMPKLVGGIIFLGELPYMGILGPNDRIAAERRVGIADFTGVGDTFAVSPDGLTIQFALDPLGGKPFHFSLATKTMAPGDAHASDDLVRPNTENPDLDLRDWQGGYQPTLNGQPLQLRAHEQALSATVAADGQSLVLGSLWQIRRFDKGGKLLWGTEIAYSAQGVLITSDNRFVIAALGDGTIRWYAGDTGIELLAFFPDVDGQRWIAWTPSGYYMASANGDSLIGWQVNQGRERAAIFYPVGQFGGQYLRPDIVLKTLALLNERDAIRAVASESGRESAIKPVAQILPPVVDIISPLNRTSITETEVHVRYRVRAPSHTPIKQILVRISGHLLAPIGPPSLDAEGEAVADLDLIVPQHDSDLVIYAENEFGASEPAKIDLKWSGPNVGPTEATHKVNVLAVGVSKYEDFKLQRLQYADKDAGDFVAAIQQQKGKAFRDVDVKVITNEDATIAGVRSGLAWLDSVTGPDDIGILFLAGHGFNESDGTYYYLPRDADLDNLQKTGLPYNEILNALKGIAGYSMLFIDTCHAGAVVGSAGQMSTEVDSLINRLNKQPKGIMIYAAATGEQSSTESSLWRNGAFTHSIVEGLSGNARYSDRSYITTTMLELYVKETVRDLTGGLQTPTVSMPIGVPDLLMARIVN